MEEMQEKSPEMQGNDSDMKKRMDRSGLTVFLLAVVSFILGIVAAG